MYEESDRVFRGLAQRRIMGIEDVTETNLGILDKEIRGYSAEKSEEPTYL